MLALNNVTKAGGPGNVDVTAELGIAGKSTIIGTAKVSFVMMAK